MFRTWLALTLLMPATLMSLAVTAAENPYSSPDDDDDILTQRENTPPEPMSAHEIARRDKAERRAKKINAYLNSLGINHPYISEFVSTAGERVEGRYLRLTEYHIEGEGRIVLHYRMRPKISSKLLELKYQPYDSKTEYVATRESLMMYYKYEF